MDKKLLDYFWEFQLEKGFISNSDVRSLSQKLKISVVELEGVISFYHFFHREPTGRFTIYLNNSIVSEIKGYHDVLVAFENETGATLGGVDPTGTFGLYETSCIGMSDQEPAALINFCPFTNLTPKKVKTIVSKLLKGAEVADLMDEVKTELYTPAGDNTLLFKPYEIGKSLNNILVNSSDDIIRMLKESGLSGRGGAFFPTGLKWEFARRSYRKQKYVICNADEGEPGTFKDRVLLAENPGLVIEGMILGAYAIGASKGYIYLRGEYQYLLPIIEETLGRFRNIGSLGDNILGKDGFNFDIEVVLGGGAYVCGEETALIESLEGKRGAPRTKVYFPVEKGLFDKPTIVNNVETFASVARIFEFGIDHYKNLGTEKSTGTKLISISGDCTKPGVYEIEFGMTIKELLDLCGAKSPKYVQVSGPSGTLIGSKEFSRKICAEDLICGGSFMIFNNRRDLFDILNNFSNFFKEESCGVCTPCRAGNYLIGRRLDKVIEGEATMSEIEEIETWSNIIQNSSRCGLGKTSTNFLLDALKRFPKEFAEKSLPDEQVKDFDLEDAIHDYIDFVIK